MRPLTTIVSCALLLSACLELPDLEPVAAPQPSAAIIGIVPERGAAASDYCKLRTLRGRTLLNVAFQNSGDLDYAGGAQISVRFGRGIVRTVTMKPIPAGATRRHAVAVPRSCFRPDCKFSISWTNQPAVSGICIG